MLTRLFEGGASWQPVLMALGPTLLVAWLAARMARRVARAILAAILGDTLTVASPLVRGPLRIVGVSVFVLVVSLLFFPALEMAGLRPTTGVALHTLAAWLFSSGLRVFLIALFAYALIRAIALLVQRFEFELTQGTGLDALERAKRARTLGTVVSKAGTALIVGIAVLMILRELHVDIAPVLTGAGVAGLAVGFGAQTLVRDIISGFFLILEDQVRVGDAATINGVGGLIEQLNLRTIVLRDQEGAVHVFPNGAVTTLANRSKDFSYCVIDVGISYREDPDRVAALLENIGAELQVDPQFGPSILEPIEVLGVESFADWSVRLRARIKTVPLKSAEIGRELRRRIRKDFAREGIDVPYPALGATVADSKPAPSP
jgi:small conductance mechanosensitive channel